MSSFKKQVFTTEASGETSSSTTSTITQEYQKNFVSSDTETTLPIPIAITEKQLFTREFSPAALPFEAYGHANTHTTDHLYMKTFNVLAPADQLYPFTKERVQRMQDYEHSRERDKRRQYIAYLNQLDRKKEAQQQSRERVENYRRINASYMVGTTQK
jgi:hypothetical protein